MMKFQIQGEYLFAIYKSKQENEWLVSQLRAIDEVAVRKTFHIQTKHLRDPLPEDESSDFDGECVFRIAELDDQYFRIDSEIVRTKHVFNFHRDMSFSQSYFIAERGISVLRRIDDHVDEDLYIGGTRDGAIPEAAYADLCRRFPNSTELDKYASCRIESCLRDYFETVSDTQKSFERYLNKKLLKKAGSILPVVAVNELQKYRALLEKLQAMLNSEAEYSEHNWQTEILQIIQLLYPKYIRVFRGAPVGTSADGKKRFVDIMLVDFAGNIDLIEVKKPFDNCILSKRQYRDNFIPMKELSGTIMQMEKYAYYLTEWGRRGEAELTKKYERDLPTGMHLKIINPKGMIIMGRGNQLSQSQLDDFEIVKRKYKNILDIVTYDDLLSRLRFTISMFESEIQDKSAETGFAVTNQ